MSIFDRVFDGASQRAFREVAEARRAALEAIFGHYSPLMVVPRAFAEVWPQGSILQQPLPDRGWVTFSDGLTNLGMPSAVRLDAAGQRVTRVPRAVAPDWAGYGYELAVVTPNAERWALDAVAAVVAGELDSDTMLLERVRDEGAVFVPAGNVMLHVRHARAPWPDEIELPNGVLHLLVAVRVETSTETM